MSEALNQPPPLAGYNLYASDRVLREALHREGAGWAEERVRAFGNGYVEEWGMARLYREAPLNSIWEGSGNIQCLDVLRALAKTPESLDLFLAEVEAARGADARLDAAARELRDGLGRRAGDPAEIEGQARRWVERLALALQGALLIRAGSPSAVVEGFCATRLGGEGGRAFGTLPAGVDLETILDHARLAE